jgi:hypothetical protein
MQVQRLKSAVTILAIATSLLTCSTGNQQPYNSAIEVSAEKVFKKKAMISSAM